MVRSLAVISPFNLGSSPPRPSSARRRSSCMVRPSLVAAFTPPSCRTQRRCGRRRSHQHRFPHLCPLAVWSSGAHLLRNHERFCTASTASRTPVAAMDCPPRSCWMQRAGARTSMASNGVRSHRHHRWGHCALVRCALATGSVMTG